MLVGSTCFHWPYRPTYLYYPNPSKTCLIVKSACYDAEVSIFHDSGVVIAVEGKCHLVGHILFCYFICYSESWKSCLIYLWPNHMLLLLLVDGITYLVRCIPDIGNLCSPLEEMIRTK